MTCWSPWAHLKVFSVV